MPTVKHLIDKLRQETRADQIMYWHERIFWLEQDRKQILHKYEKAKGENYLTRAIIGRRLPIVERQIKKARMRLRLALNPEITNKDDITPDMISRAREYPLDSMLEINSKGKARCVAHEDKNPSMDCRNGFVYCYSCGFSGDAIDVAMKLWGLKFKDAVRRLQ